MSRRGFSLVEMIGVLAALGAALTISVLLLTTIIRTEQLSRSTGESLVWRANLAERFRDDVHATIRTHEHYNQFDAGPECVILEQADGSHVIYEYRDGSLLRHSPAGKVMLPLPGKRAPQFVVTAETITLRLPDPPRAPYDITIARRQP